MGSISSPCTVALQGESVKRIDRQGRILGIVSRGGINVGPLDEM